MPPVVRRLRALMVLVLVAAAFSMAGPGAAGAAPPGISVTGVVHTPDGRPVDTQALVRLWSFFPAGDAAYPTPQDSELIPVGGDGSFTLEAPGPGYYVISVDAPGQTTRDYLRTWSGDVAYIPTAYEDPGVFFISEAMPAPPPPQTITMLEGTRVTGTVRGSTGQPVADALIEAGRWVDDSTYEVLGGRFVATSRDDGTYTLRLPPGIDAGLTVPARTGYRPWTLGGQTGTRTVDNSLAIGRAEVTRDIELAPDWSNVGTGQVVQDERCLQNSGNGTTDLDGLRLDLWQSGLVLPEGVDAPSDPLDPSSPVPALVPYWTSTSRAMTWGVDGSRLCVLWQSAVEGIAYQVQHDADDGATTFRYGRVPHNPYSIPAQAGWTEGTTDDAVQIVLPRDGAHGYADDSPTGLVHGPSGSTTPGRYGFTFTGFLRPDLAPAARLVQPPTVSPTAPAAGQTLQVTTGTWVDDSTARAGSDLTFTYQWMRGWEPIPDATGPTWTAPRDAQRGEYQVRVVAHRAGRERVLRDVELVLAEASDPPPPSGSDDGPAASTPPGATTNAIGSPATGTTDRSDLPSAGGERLAWLGLGLVLVTAGVVLRGRSVSGGGRRRR